MAKELEVNIKVNGLTEIKKDLKNLKGELVKATDPAEIDRLSRAAGELSDKIAEANERIKVFSAGSDFEKVSNGLGLVGSQLASFDFDGASESAKVLTNTIKSMDPKAVAQGFKDFTATVGQLGNAFVQMGIKLLANPLFAIVAVITAVVVAIVLLKDKIKIVEQAFDILMIPIKALIQGLKDLSDWLGLTSFAEEEAAQKSLDATNKRIAANEKLTASMDKEYARQIALAKANGKDTEAIEIQAAKSRQAISAGNVKDLNERIAQQRARLEKQTKEQQTKTKENIEELRKQRDAQLEINKDSVNEIAVIRAQANTDARNEQQKADEKASEDAKRAGDKRVQDTQREKDALRALEVKYADEIKGLNAKTDSEKLTLQKEQEQRELDSIKLSKEAKGKAQSELDEKYKILETQQEEVKQENLRNIVLKYEDEIAALKDNSAQAQLNRAKEAELKEIQDLENNESVKAAIVEKYRLLQQDLDNQKFETDNQKALEKIEKDALTFEESYALITEQERLLSENKNLSEEERTRIAKANAEARTKIDELEKKAKLQNLQVVSSALATASNLFGESTAAGKAFALASTAISTYLSAQQAYASQLIPGDPSSPFRATLAAAVAVAAGLANVKKILSVKVPGGKDKGGSVPSGGAASSAPATSSSATVPSATLFGAQSNANTVSAARNATQATEQSITVNAVVSETEMTAAQSRVANIQRSAEL
jgi:hypothetical protein